MQEFNHIKAGDIVGDVGEIFRPKRRISVVNAAEASMYISTPGGYSGKWRSETTPYMAEPMNCMAMREYNSVIFVGAARTGKTLGLIEGGITYILTCDPADVLIVHMTEAAARKYSRMRVNRLLKNSPDLKALLSPITNDDNILSKFFRNGTALMLGHPTPTQLSAQDYKYVFLSDYDRMPDDNGEGEIFTQAIKRNQTFGSGGMCMAESSPGRDFTDMSWKPSTPHEAPPVGGILGLYNTGDRRILHWNCIECGDHIPVMPGLGLFNLPDEGELIDRITKVGAKSSANELSSIVCPECGSIIDHKHKSRMNIDGFWKKDNENIKSSTASFWLGGIAAKFQTWQSLLEKEFLALKHYSDTGSEIKLKTTRNTDQAIPFIPLSASQKLTSDELERRAEDLPKRKVMEGVRYITASVDVQATKFVVQVEGAGVNDEIWIIDRFDIAISKRELHGDIAQVDPAGYKDDWKLLIDKVICARYELDDDSGRTMGVVQTTCDSGGKSGTTENAYFFWKYCKDNQLSDKFALIKGLRPKPDSNVATIRKAIMDKTSSAATKANVVDQMPLWLLNTTILKDSVSANLKKTEYGKDYYHFVDWMPSHFYGEIVAETRGDKGWDNLNKARNETFDLLCYNKAGRKIKLDKYWKNKIDWAAPPAWAEVWDNNSEVDNAKNVDQQSKTTKQRRVRMRMGR